MRPRALAALRLMTSSNLVGFNWISAGLTPSKSQPLNAQAESAVSIAGIVAPFDRDNRSAV